MESKKSPVFSDIRTSQELIQYLNDDYQRLKNSPYLYQYTTLSNAIKIINGQKWHLGNAKDMNDVLEYQNGDKSRWKDLFFTCFMTEDKENIGMWSMYSQPWEQGVKITLPRQVVKDWIKNVSTVYEISSKTFLPTGRLFKNPNLFLSSVAYTNVDSAQKRNESPMVSWSNVKNAKLYHCLNRSELTGYIKDSAWSYEKEIRMKAEFNNSLGFERVAIDVPDFVIDSMTITAGPKFRGNLVAEIQKKIQRNICLDESVFYKKLNIKSPCDNCNYKEVKQMPRDEHHVVPSKNGGWDVKRSGGERASVHTDTKKEAIDAARTISRNQNTELVIHNQDGKISRSDSHGNDPCPPKDTK